MIMKEWLIRLILVSLGFIISAFVIEFGLSRFAPHPRTLSTGLHEPDKNIGWKGMPGKEKKYVKGRIVSYVKMNSYGFRDRERTYEKEKGAFRIIVLGDSFTESLEVPLEQTFPYILEERLNWGNSSKKFEVVNLGMSGFGTAQEYLTLKHYGLKYQPDFVILAFFIGNDVRNNSLILTTEIEGRAENTPFFVLKNGRLEEVPFKIKLSHPGKDEEQTRRGASRGLLVPDTLKKLFPNIFYTFSDWINKTPWLGNLLWNLGIKESKPGLLDKSKQNRVPTDYYIYAEENSPEWQNAWEVTKGLILKLYKELEVNKIGFMVVIIPNEFEFRTDRWNNVLNELPEIKDLKFDLKKPEHILVRFLEANNIDYLLLRPEFEKYTRESGKRLHFSYKYEQHWNIEGHALVAQLIYRKLKGRLDTEGFFNSIETPNLIR